MYEPVLCIKNRLISETISETISKQRLQLAPCQQQAYVRIGVAPGMPCLVSTLPCQPASLKTSQQQGQSPHHHPPSPQSPPPPFSVSEVKSIQKEESPDERAQRFIRLFCLQSELLLQQGNEKLCVSEGKSKIFLYFKVTLIKGPLGKDVLSVLSDSMT